MKANKFFLSSCLLSFPLSLSLSLSLYLFFSLVVRFLLSFFPYTSVYVYFFSFFLPLFVIVNPSIHQSVPREINGLIYRKAHPQWGFIDDQWMMLIMMTIMMMREWCDKRKEYLLSFMLSTVDSIITMK